MSLEHYKDIEGMVEGKMGIVVVVDSLTVEGSVTRLGIVEALVDRKLDGRCLELVGSYFWSRFFEEYGGMKFGLGWVLGFDGGS